MGTGTVFMSRKRASWLFGVSITFAFFFFFQAEDGIRDLIVTGVQTCALPISPSSRMSPAWRVCGISSFNRFTERKKVLLPQPDGPIRAVTARRGMATVTSNNAWVGPYQKLYVRTSRMGGGRSERRTGLSPRLPPRLPEGGKRGW